MAYWLFKSEPSTWSWDDQKKKGDLGCFYHSVDEKRIVGIGRVIGEHRPDPTDETGRFGLVDIEAVCDMPAPVTLADVKGEPRLAEMALLKQSRLSVQPVRAGEWKRICAMGGLKKAP